MAVVKQQVYCTFPKDQIKQPILYSLGQTFNVIPNIRGASINDDIGLVYLELEGEEDEVGRAVEYMIQEGVKCEVLQQGESPPPMS